MLDGPTKATSGLVEYGGGIEAWEQRVTIQPTKSAYPFCRLAAVPMVIDVDPRRGSARAARNGGHLR